MTTHHQKGAQTMAVEFYVAKRDGYSQARRHTRVPTDFPVLVRSDGLRMADRARDISEVGIGVATDKPLSPMTLVSVQLELPHTRQPVSLLGRVMWSSGAAMGIRFEQNDPILFDVVDRLRRELDSI